MVDENDSTKETLDDRRGSNLRVDPRTVAAASGAGSLGLTGVLLWQLMQGGAPMFGCGNECVKVEMFKLHESQITSHAEATLRRLNTLEKDFRAFKKPGQRYSMEYYRDTTAPRIEALEEQVSRNRLQIAKLPPSYLLEKQARVEAQIEELRRMLNYRNNHQ